MLTPRLGPRTQNTRSLGMRTHLCVTNLATRTLHNISLYLVHIRAGAWGSVVVKTPRTVPGSISGGVTGDFFRGTPDRTVCPEVDSTSENVYQGFLLW